MRSSTVARLAPLAIFFGALIANRRAATSLLVWADTVYDQSHVDRCLGENLCTLMGTQTSVRGFFHAVAWLDLRTLLQWLGVGPAGLLWFVQVTNALAATIVFQLASQLGGRMAGAAAAAVLVFGISLGFPLDGVHNLSCLPFLGAVLTVACTAVVNAPGIGTVVLAALVAGVMANVHIICALTGVSVACSALAARRRRLLLAAVAVGVFSVAMIGFAPPSWQQNLLAALGQRPDAPITATPTWPTMEVTWWTLLALAMWTGSLVTRAPAWTAYRRASIGALAVIVPTLTVVLIAPAFGFYTEAKYLVPVHAACAIAAGLAIGRAGQALLLRWPVTSRAFELASPFVVALAIAGGAGLTVGYTELALTVDDLTAAAHLLRAEQRWDDRHMVRAFSAPARANTLTGLLQQQPTGEVPPRSETDVAHETATLIRVTDAELPDPPPPSWHVLRRSAGDATVLVLSRAQLDWRRFELCIPGPDDAAHRCDPVTWDGFDPRHDAVNALPHMPPAGVRWTGAFRLRVPVLTHAGAGAGAIFMPRGSVCGGRIASLRGIAGTISDDLRRVTFAASRSHLASGYLELEWSIGSPECDPSRYDGLPPFVIEGQATDVDRLERLFRGRELGDAAVGAS
jgi:hypothetical protein